MSKNEEISNLADCVSFLSDDYDHHLKRVDRDMNEALNRLHKFTRPRPRRKPFVPDQIEVIDERQESYIRIETTEQPGVVRLQVGDVCIRAINQEINVAVLAAILTRSKDIGFRKMLEDHGWEPEWINERMGTKKPND